MPGNKDVDKNNFEDLFGISQETIKSIAPQANNIMQARFDMNAYDKLKHQSNEIASLQFNAGISKPAFPALLQDIWATFYKYVPELTPDENVSSMHKLNRPFIERMLEDNETQKIRISTVMDEMSAGLATLEAGRQLLREIDNRPELKRIFEKGSEHINHLEQAEKPTEEAIKKFLDHLQEHAKDLRRAMREAVKHAAEQVNDMQQSLAGWGFEPGELKNAPIGERLNITKRLMSPRLKKLAELIGRFRNLAKSRQKNKITHTRDELHSITTGNDIKHMLPNELAALRHPVRKLDFYKKYTQKTALQYDLKAKEKQNRGPMIVAVDTSGSMQGTPIDWAIATALALIDTAARQKRRAKIIFFNTNIIKTMTFEPAEKNIEKLIELASIGTGGGTAFEPPMQDALNTMQETNYKNADFIFITDGLCRINDDFINKFMDLKNSLAFNVWTILIGDEPDGQLKQWSNQVWSAYQLTEDIAGDIFEAVI